MEPILLAAALTTLVEGLMEYFGQSLTSMIKPYVAAVLAVGLCLAYNVDLLAALGYEAVLPYVGQITTGLIVGRGSNYVNDFWNRLQQPAAVVTVQPKVVERVSGAEDLADDVASPDDDERARRLPRVAR